MNDRGRRLIEEARKTNRYRDKTERKIGFTPESEQRLDVRLRTVFVALDAALNLSEERGERAWEIVAEAYCLVEDIAKTLEREGSKEP